MMTVAETARIVHAGASILLLLTLCLCWKGYRVDFLRERLFALRDELFDYAMDNDLFDHPAYGGLRSTMNGMIRFAHKITFPRLLLTLTFQKISPVHPTPDFYERWKKAVESLSNKEQRERLENFHSRMGLLVVQHMITGSISLCSVSLVVFACIAIHGATKAVAEVLKRWLPGLELLEAQATLLEET